MEVIDKLNDWSLTHAESPHHIELFGHDNVNDIPNLAVWSHVVKRLLILHESWDTKIKTAEYAKVLEVPIQMLVKRQ